MCSSKITVILRFFCKLSVVKTIWLWNVRTGSLSFSGNILSSCRWRKSSLGLRLHNHRKIFLVLNYCSEKKAGKIRSSLPFHERSYRVFYVCSFIPWSISYKDYHNSRNFHIFYCLFKNVNLCFFVNVFYGVTKLINKNICWIKKWTILQQNFPNESMKALFTSLYKKNV